MKVHIQSALCRLTRVISEPSHRKNNEREEVYCNRRNTVERVRFGDKDFVIKKYKRPCPHKLPHLHLVPQKQSAARLWICRTFSATGNRDRPSGSLYRNQKEWFLPHRILYFRIPPLPACYGYVRYGNGGRREKTAKTWPRRLHSPITSEQGLATGL